MNMYSLRIRTFFSKLKYSNLIICQPPCNTTALRIFNRHLQQNILSSMLIIGRSSQQNGNTLTKHIVVHVNNRKVHIL